MNDYSHLTVFNDGIFYPGLITEAEREVARRSHLWSVILGIHYATKGELLCSKITQVANSPQVHRASMVHKSGAGSCLIASDSSGEISVTGAVDPYTSSLQSKPFVKSKHARYIVNKLNNNKEGPGDMFERHVTQGKDAVRRGLQDLANHYKSEKIKIIRDEDVVIPREYHRLILEAAFGVGTLASAPLEDTKRLDELMKAYASADMSSIRAQKKAEEFFTTNKWMLAFYPNHGIMVGAVDSSSVTTAIMTSALEGFYGVPGDRVTPTVTVPFRTYKSLASMDPSIHDDVMGALTLFKMHRESKGLTKCVDETGFIPALGFTLFADAGAASWRPSVNSQLLILDRVV